MILQTQPSFTGSEQDAMNQYLQSGGWLTEHKKTREFEGAIADFLGIDHCIAVPNGTAALMAAYSVIPRKEKEKYIIVPDMTMIATANAASFVGLTPFFVDVSADTGCMDADQVMNAVEPIADQVVGVAYVDFNGRSDGLHDIKELCCARKWALIEDACQAFGSFSEHNVKLGTVGDIGCFSLSPHKIITTGQGGLIVTNNASYAKRLRQLKDFGRAAPGVDDHVAMGINLKFTDLQAVIGLEQIKNIEWRMARKKEIYERYRQHFREVPYVSMPPLSSHETPWFIDVYVNDPAHTATVLEENDIGCRPMYPQVSTQAPYEVHEENENSAELSRSGLWLPSYLELTNQQIDTVCKVLKSAG
jgi:perosamine synthetase